MKSLLITGLSIVAVGIFSITGAANAGEMLNGAGASFPYPVYSAWGYQYNKDTGVRLNYQSIGSGGGQRQIASRTVEFGASDAPLKPARLKKDNLLQFPAVIGGVVPVINMKGVKKGAVKLDSATLCKVFLGEVTNWNDEAITGLNKGVKLPNKKITVVRRSDGSGTTAIFTSYMAGVCKEWKDKVGAGKAVKWPVGIGGKGNEGVANYVKRVNGSIGYVEFAYAKQNNLNYVKLKNASGSYVEPSFDTFKAAAASGNFNAADDFYLWLVNSPGKDAWPIAGATFILLAKEKKETNKKVVKFYDWAFDNGDETAMNLVYVPLPASLKAEIRAYWKSGGLY